MGGMGGSYILELSKYPLRFHIFSFLLFLFFSFPFSTSVPLSLSLSRFPYFIPEHTGIACWTVTGAWNLYMNSKECLSLLLSAPMRRRAASCWWAHVRDRYASWLNIRRRMRVSVYAERLSRRIPRRQADTTSFSVSNARRIYLPYVLFLIKPRSIVCPSTHYPVSQPARPPMLPFPDIHLPVLSIMPRSAWAETARDRSRGERRISEKRNNKNNQPFPKLCVRRFPDAMPWYWKKKKKGKSSG